MSAQEAQPDAPGALKKRLLALAPWAMVLTLAAANALLLRQNYQLRGALASRQPAALRAGERAPAFAATDLRGAPLEVGYAAGGPRRVMFYFTPACRFCHEQFPHWREVIARADRSRFEVIGLASDAEDKRRLEEYLRRFDCGEGSQTPLRVALVSDEVRRAYKLTATPTTLVVGADGVIEKVWPGLWDAGALAEAGRLFGLPSPAASD